MKGRASMKFCLGYFTYSRCKLDGCDVHRSRHVFRDQVDHELPGVANVAPCVLRRSGLLLCCMTCSASHLTRLPASLDARLLQQDNWLAVPAVASGRPPRSPRLTSSGSAKSSTPCLPLCAAVTWKDFSGYSTQRSWSAWTRLQQVPERQERFAVPENWSRRTLALSPMFKSVEPALIDGVVGLVWAPRGRLVRVLRLAFTGGKIVRVDVIGNPGRLRELDVAILEGI